MTTDEARRKFEVAKEQGAAARRGGRKRDACPYKSGTMDAQRNAWFTGWDDEDMARRARR